MFHKLKSFLFCLFIFLITSYSISIISAHHTPENEKSPEEVLMDSYNYLKQAKQYMVDYFKDYSIAKQAYISIIMINSAIIPIFLLLSLYSISHNESVYISAFSAGCIIADVFLHNFPEFIKETNSNEVNRSLGLMICYGIICFYLTDKIIGIMLFYTKENKNQFQKIIIIMIGDILHNFNDGLAITSAYMCNINLGVVLTIFNYFHEFPHKLGDFSILLKQEVSLKSVMAMQVFILIGSFLGVYTCLTFEHEYGNQILAYSSGGFLYISINTIFQDIKESEGLMNVVLSVVSIVIGIYFLMMLA